MTITEYSNNSKPLKIAIIGAGLVGAVAGIALSKLSNVNVTIYERSEKPREVGAWIGLTESSLQVLRKLVDIDELQKILFRGDQDGGYVKRHWKTGEILAVNLSSTTTDRRLKQARTHRVPLHNFLFSYVPEGLIKYGYSANKVNVTKDGVDVIFEEKDPIHADLLVAADGIYSRTRRQFTGDTVQYKGAVAYRNVFPIELIKDIPSLPNDTSAWVKDGDIMFFSPLGLDQYGVVALVFDPEDVAKKFIWNENTGEWGREHLRKHFADWDPIIDKVLKVMPDITSFPLETAPWLKDLTVGNRLAFVGDAAHPTSGAFGAGAQFGFGDVWALYRSLQETVSNAYVDTGLPAEYDLHRALFLFNETRRHFLARVEKQLGYDADTYKRYISTARNDKEWRARFRQVESPLEWMRENNVEADFQRVVDEQGPFLRTIYID